MTSIAGVNKTQKKHLEQQALLNELESIKSLLGERDPDEMVIPILEEMVTEDMLVEKMKGEVHSLNPATPLANVSESIANGVLPGQQALFNETETAPSQKPTPTLGENPFLPKHIRDRLNARNALSREHHSSAPPSSSTFPPQNPSAQSHQVIIDNLIAEFMPKIEAELRKRLKESLQ